MPDPRFNRTDQQGRRLVDCDEQCGAYEQPDRDSLEELRAALEHWEEHGLLSGCSHGR